MSRSRNCTRSVKEILLSPEFKREVSILLFAFAAINALISLLLFSGGQSDAETLATGGAILILAILYAVFATLIRRGSNVALVLVGIFFAVDTALLFVPTGERGSAVALLARGALIVFVVKWIRKQRRMVD